LAVGAVLEDASSWGVFMNRKIDSVGSVLIKALIGLEFVIADAMAPTPKRLCSSTGNSLVCREQVLPDGIGTQLTVFFPS